MRILLAHNYYKLAGGEDRVVAAEKKMFESRGHEVITYFKSNDEIDSYSFKKKAQLISNTTYSKQAYKEVARILIDTKPDICHVHNFLPLISPAIFDACKNNNVPVVHTLHNYRLMCTNGLLFRDGRVCEECISNSAYHAILKKCYRNSHVQTYSVARMLEKNKDIWQNKIDAFFCLTQFAKEKFIQHGLPKDKIIVKPNFIKPKELDSISENNLLKKEYLIYVGRLEQNKGVNILYDLSQSLNKDIYIVGEGPLEKKLQNVKNITLLGKKNRAQTLKLIQQAKALILPSISYEGGLPLTALEAFACKTVVIATNIGSMKSMIKNAELGLLFESKSINSLKTSINFLDNHPIKVEKIKQNAFHYLKTTFTEDHTYNILYQTYKKLME